MQQDSFFYRSQLCFVCILVGALAGLVLLLVAYMPI